MLKPASNLKNFPQSVQTHQELIQEALAQGSTRAKVIQTKTIEMGRWMKLQCQYGCSYFGKRFTCPPFSPTSDEMAVVLIDYEKALLIYGETGADVQEIVLNLETSLKRKGFNKAWAMCAQPCNLCEVCTIDTYCKYPEKARPTLRACGIDVQQTVFNNGWGDAGSNQPCAEDHHIGMILLA